MAAHLVSAKITPELHEQLMLKAAEQKMSVSEAVREAIKAWVEDNPIVAGENLNGAEITEQLKDMEITVSAALHAVGSVMGAALRESAKTRVFARLSTSYAIDMASQLTDKKVLDTQDKEKAMKKLDEMAEADSDRLWTKVINPHSEQGD